MFLRMRQHFATTSQLMRFREIVDVDASIGREWVARGIAEPSATPPPEIAALLDRLEDGAGRECLFVPFVGEFGHCVMSHIRLVHFHRASRKIVCCRPGEEVLYPSASEFCTDWQDPVPDQLRIATMRHSQPDWTDIIARFPNHHIVRAGGLTPAQEIFAIKPDETISFKTRLRGLRVDVAFGVRQRSFEPCRNWSHWPKLACAARDAGLSFAVVGSHPTTFDLPGQLLNTADLDTDAAVEILQNCKLYIGTDSGASHLAATVGTNMFVFREWASGSRNLIPRMRAVNPFWLEFYENGWDDPDFVVQRMLSKVTRCVA